MSAARRASLPTGRSAASEAAEFAPQGEYAFEYPFAAATITSRAAMAARCAAHPAARPIATAPAARSAREASTWRGVSGSRAIGGYEVIAISRCCSALTSAAVVQWQHRHSVRQVHQLSQADPSMQSRQTLIPWRCLPSPVQATHSPAGHSHLYPSLLKQLLVNDPWQR